MKTNKRLVRSLNIAIMSLVSLLCCTAVSAKDYKVEVLVFENIEPYPAFESQPYVPPQEPRSNAETWPLEASMLLEHASIIGLSPDYNLVRYMSWGQESLPLSESAAREITEPNINGWIKVYANQLLFANLDLDVNGYRMVEKRRLKLDELHFFDHPKFGVLMQVSRLEQQVDENNDNQAVSGSIMRP